ncbi:hypothetical protein [Mesorhizobium sp. WSM3859]|uniref:hypothetical protein n=1 Tax=Mesorhizobium sp. WSM3859 TaxID=2029402 RepID=UPI000BAECD7F|nr:hypothetical protein [Mesorhizobium sp. WSM3859]PBC09191.1 hypothetical protein CK230_17050 [Mesorhizobium sp. WSM3859]
MVDWDSALVALEGKVAEVFDTQTFHVFPTAKGVSVNDDRVADPSRAGFDFRGSIHFGPVALMPGFSHPATMTVDSRERGRESPSHEAVITALSSDWPHPIKVEDIIGWGAARYVVAAIPEDGGRRKAIYVNRTKVAP